MITRTVPTFVSSTEGLDSTSGQTRTRPPEDVLRQARATSITGILGQIASVASYSLDILRELKDEITEVQGRMATLNQRVDVLADVVNDQQQHGQLESKANLLHLLPSQEESDRVLRVQSISSGEDHNKRPGAVVEAYERCEGIPPLELLDKFYDTDARSSSENESNNLQGGEVAPRTQCSLSRKKYSHPGFFMEEWLKNEKERQQRALEIKEERRRERRASHNHRKAQKQLQQQVVEAETAGADDAEQKMKFLKIRSWREIYGTGEGKELMKSQPNVVRSPSLRELRRKAHQSLASLAPSPTRSEDRQLSPQAKSQPSSPPASPPITQSRSAHDQLYTLGIDQVTPPPPLPMEIQPTPSTVTGAFMQEMDDDEIAMEMGMDEEQFANGIPPPPPPLEEFVDHGLSYYYDPNVSHSLVPPPPPEFDEQSKSDIFFDANEDEEVEIPPPPPPPFEEFDHPKPLPPPPPSEPPRLRLMDEIQLGTALRSVHEPRPQREAPVKPLNPQQALLHQILQKQSRQLRPTETRRPAPVRIASTTAPFADSIARILERRTMIAYDSDSAESQKSNGSNSDKDEW